MAPTAVAADMLTIDLADFMVELKEGTVQHVGASNTAAEAKLYDVTGVEVREFGDERVKVAFEDGEGNAVEVALFPDEAAEVRRGLDLLTEAEQTDE